jgi:hypothetical protein
VDCIHVGKVHLATNIIIRVLTWNRRVCVLHGQPVSISRRDIDAGQPSVCPELRAKDRIDTLPNVLAMIRLTGILEDARDKMYVANSPPSNVFLISLEDLRSEKLQRSRASPAWPQYRNPSRSSMNTGKVSPPQHTVEI